MKNLKLRPNFPNAVADGAYRKSEFPLLWSQISNSKSDIKNLKWRIQDVG